jgi:hypothetical protein
MILKLKDIHKKYGKLKLRTYPTFDFKKHVYYSALLRLIHFYSQLCLYNKAEIKQIITKELSWRDYGGKHYE